MTDFDVLEKHLLALGSQEAALEEALRHLKVRMKAAVAAGNLDEADAVWLIFDKQRALLSTLQTEITHVERLYYSHRRQRR